MSVARIRGPWATRITALALLATALLSVACQADGLVDETPIPSEEALREQLAERRALNLQRLDDYRQAGVYPRNRVVPDRPANVFIDEDGHLCAVANLMWLDSQQALVEETARTNNLVVLADVHEGPLYDWILSSGFTQAEIARIQEPYEPYDPNGQNFEIIEDQRLDDHFTEVEDEIEEQDVASLLAAARAQREELEHRYFGD